MAMIFTANSSPSARSLPAEISENRLKTRSQERLVIVTREDWRFAEICAGHDKEVCITIM
jgi:hypothetical protein